MPRTFKLIIFLLVGMMGCAAQHQEISQPQEMTIQSQEKAIIGQGYEAPSGSVPSVSESPAQPGEQILEVALTDTDGKKVRLKQLMASQKKETPTLLMFSTTNCSYCDDEHVDIQNVKSRFGEDIEVLHVLIYETPDSASEYLKSHQVTGTVLFDPEADAALTYNIGLVPTILLVDSDGYVNYIGNYTPEEDITQLVTKLNSGERVREVRPGSG